MTIVEFLRARLADDEQIACAADVEFTSHGWHDLDGACDAEVDHIYRFDGARVLREVEAKRRIVDVHDLIWRDIGWVEDGEETYEELPVCGLCVPKHSHFPTRAGVPEGGCTTLRLLALPYSDHPDYNPTWSPA